MFSKSPGSFKNIPQKHPFSKNSGGHQRVRIEFMRLSIIIPAFNEEKYIAGTILALNLAVDACNRQLDFSEIVVCDNNSTDRTSEICKELGAVVVFEPHNQISRARNSGAKAAKGDWFLFVDADTIVSVETLQELIDCVLTGRFAGGGGQLQMDTRNRLAKFVAFFLIRLFRLLKWAGGAFVFCRADAFQEIDGFDEEYYAGEEVFFWRTLKVWGSVV